MSKSPRVLAAARADHYGLTYARNLRTRYGLTIEAYNAMLVGQNGLCAACGEPERRKGRTRLAVDHDHVTGAIRGLLCDHCNRVAGHRNTSPRWLHALAAYLERTA